MDLNIEDSRGHDDVLYLQTLGRGINLLKLLSPKPLTSKQIEERMGLNRSAVYRIIHTLEVHSMVEKDETTGLVRLTPLLWQLGSPALGPGELRNAASRSVRMLRDEYGETVHLAVYARGGEVVYIDKAEGSYPIGSYTELGGRAPAHAVATGKALLAWQDEKEWDRLAASGPLERFTSLTITRMEDLAKEMATIRKCGYAENKGSWRFGVGGFAVPLFDQSDIPFAALGFSGPIERLLKRKDQLIPALLSVNLGTTPPRLNCDRLSKVSVK